MHDWMGSGLVALGLGLIVSGIMKRRARMRAPASEIRPEFAAMGEMIRPLILFAVGIFAAKMTLFYFVLGGERFLTSLDFAGILFVLAAYASWLVLAMKRPVETADRDPISSGERSGRMSWRNLGQWEWAIGEAVVLPLLFFELHRLRRSQRRDRERARQCSDTNDGQRPG